MYLTLLGIVVLMVLFASFYLSLAESSLSNVSAIEVKTKTDKQCKKTIALKKIMANKDPYVATVLILNVLLNTGGSLLIGSLSIIAFKDYVSIVNSIFLICFTMCILYVAEMIPKLYAIQNSLKISLMVARTIVNCHKIIGFLVKFSVFICSPFLKKEESPTVTLSDVKGLVKIAQGDGLLRYEEAKIIKNTLRLGEKFVSEIMIPANDVEIFFENDCPFEKKDLILNMKHNRIIVIAEENKQPIGVVLRSQLLENIIKGKCFKIKDMMHNMLVLNKKDNLTQALIGFNKNEDHLAVVKNDDSHFEGVLSVEDILAHITNDFRK